MIRIKLILSWFMMLALLACNNQEKGAGQNTEEPGPSDLPPGHYGMMITEDGAEDATSLPAAMADTSRVDIKLAGNIVSSCTHSGCWMNVGMADEQVIAVTFADGDFTIPLDAQGKNVIFEGTAYKELVPVDRLKAYARDEGASEDEIEMITEPEWEYTFVAKGVILKDEH